MDTLKAIAISIVTLAACAGCGRIARGLWGGKQESRLEKLVLETSLGAGILSLIFFVLGVLQLYRPAVIITALVIPVIALAVSVANSRSRAHGSRLPSLPGFQLSAFRFPLALLAIAAIIPALAPPAMADWDSLAYHLAVPKLYLQHGGIYHIGIMSHSNFPFLMEMLYLPAVWLHAPEAARVLNFFVGAMLVAAVALLTRKHFNAKAAPLAAIGLAGMPIVLFLATTAYIDLATALYTVIAIHLLLNHFDSIQSDDNQSKHAELCRSVRLRSIIGSAIAAGFAASTKMTGLVTIGLLVIWFLWDRFVAECKIEWKAALAFVGLAALVCLPWYVKTFIYTGNPVYPFFYGLFGGRDWTAEMASVYAASQAHFGMGHDRLSFLLLPWNLAFYPERFYDGPNLFIGPIFLVSIPFLFFAKYRSRKLVGLLGFFVAYLGIWFMLTHQSRYLVPGFAVLAVLVSAIVYEDDRFQLARRALAFTFAGTALFGIFTLWPAIRSSLPVVFGSESRDEYLTRALDIYPAQQFMNKNLPADARVALMGDTRGFYLDRTYTWADWGHNVEFTRRYTSADDLITYLKSRHISHVMINYAIFPKRNKDTEPVYIAIEKGMLEQIYPSESVGHVAVYRVKA